MQCIWSSRASFYTNAIYSPLRSSGTKLNGSLRNFSLLSRNSASTLLRPGRASLRTVAYPLTCPNHSPSDRAHLTRLPLPRDENYIPGQPKQHSFGSSTPLSKKCSPLRLGIQLRLMQHLAPASPQLPLAKPNPKAASASFSRRPPELSRAAATAIRLAFARSARWDAFHVWHSLRWSMHRYSNPPPTTPFQKPTSKFQPIDFHQAVPPKLGGHCLLHSLIRAGERRLAGKLAEQMLADGIRIHSRTLDTILRVLHPPTPPGIMTPQKLSVPPTLSHCKAKHPDVQCAITLLHGAHNHRWQRTHAMYEKTISICLLQAEVLIASLLLALLLQDYQFHTSSRTRTVMESSSKCLDATPSPSPVKLANGTLGSWSQSLTHSIVHAIRPHLERGPQDPLFQESSEALAVLAGTVDSRSLPPYRIGPLLKLLYEYPKCNTYVWHTGDDITPRRIPARNYFHGVLTRLIDFLPVEPIDCLPTEPWRRAYHGGRRGLDITVYNTLIHYSLFEQRSPLMAQRVLDSMLIARTPPLEPSKETYLIAIRGCTLLRRNDIARRVLAAATGTKELSQGSIRVVANSDVPEETPQSFSGDTCTFRELIRRVGIGDLTVPPATIPSPMDTRLLVAYALHLSKTGRARRIHSLLYQLIPEFDTSAVKVATGQAQFEDNLKERRNTNRQAQIVRAMQLGPAVLSALIVGLRCAGSTGLAERLWEIIKMAEEASWTTADPWVISVHTYTTMMQVYKAEARRIAYIPTVSEAHPPPLKSKDHARGFGRMTSLPPSSRDVILTNSGRRWVVAREMGLDVYRRMMLTEDRMKRALEQATVDNASNVEALRARLHEVPQPDARFFNTAIRLVGRQDGMRRRRQHSRLSYWRTRLRQAWQRFEVLGVTPRRHDRQLLDIADDMAARGYEIPLGYQYLLAGHAKFSRLPPRRPQYPRVPVSTPSLPYKPSFPFSLRIPKTRGLPIRRGQRYSPAAQSRANR